MRGKLHLITLFFFSSAFAYNSFPQMQEELVKAAFLEKFTQHIEWPENEKIAIDNNSFTINVVGNSDFCLLLKKIYSNRQLLGKKVNIICSDIPDISLSANIIFITKNGSVKLKEAIQICENSPCLIISESDGLAKKGSHINFYLTPDKTILFEMNKVALDKAGFKPDFLLLDFAKIVEY